MFQCEAGNGEVVDWSVYILSVSVPVCVYDRVRYNGKLEIAERLTGL